MTRNVRWHEDRQDRAAVSADRLGRLALKELDRAQVFEKKAAHHQAEARQAHRRGYHKKAAREEALAESFLKKAEAAKNRSRRLAEQASKVRQSGSRYGKAKTRIGVYDSARGWSDRDRGRARRRDERLTPDITIQGRMPTPAEYKLSLELLKDALYDEEHHGFNREARIFRRWLGKDMSDLQHTVWIAVHRNGLMRQNAEGFHRLTPYGKTYLRQRR